MCVKLVHLQIGNWKINSHIFLKPWTRNIQTCGITLQTLNFFKHIISFVVNIQSNFKESMCYVFHFENTCISIMEWKICSSFYNILDCFKCYFFVRKYIYWFYLKNTKIFEHLPVTFLHQLHKYCQPMFPYDIEERVFMLYITCLEASTFCCGATQAFCCCVSEILLERIFDGTV